MKTFWVWANLVFVLDRLTKFCFINLNYPGNQDIWKVFPGFNLVKVWNKGIAFGLFAKDSLLGTLGLILANLIILGLVFYWAKNKAYKPEARLETFGLGLIFGGGLSNLLDRLVFGSVFDFIDLYVGNYHWPAFNVADIGITVGLFILIYQQIKNVS
ncbi:signal peptidase II [Thermodesulfobacterium sp. TA1]|uniref:signal peptidase II n=1 Tax=Thermodesulfobacterium sp. TA1 TaxID=2234087 RepID=UPI0012323525|nr:signal peptidase II [Thermodesulfobacterium sp. TA1]QER41899.1 signal peptidase II [Thermodesulfobacterium sp. TA1]